MPLSNIVCVKVTFFFLFGIAEKMISASKWCIQVRFINLYLCNVFISHYIPPRVFLVLLHGT